MFLNIPLSCQLQSSEATKRKYTDFHSQPSPKIKRELDDRAILKIEKVVRNADFIFRILLQFHLYFKVPYDYSATVQSFVKHKPMKHKKVVRFPDHILTSITILWMDLFFRLFQKKCEQKLRKHARLWYDLLNSFIQRNKVVSTISSGISSQSILDNCFLLFPIQVPAWTVQNVKQNLQSGEVITCEADKQSKTFALYSICKRLKTKAGEIVRDFFFCTSCCSVLNVNLSTHYNQLKRHYEACTRIKIENAEQGLNCQWKEIPQIFTFVCILGTSIQTTVDDLCYLIERLTSVGSKHGRVESDDIDIPLILNAYTR